MTRFLDTNILVRHMTRDDEAKADACRALLRRLEAGDETVVTSNVVVAEVAYVLESPSLYGLTRNRIRELLEPIIGLRGIRILHKSMYSRVFDLYCDLNISFADSYNAALMESEGLTEVYSYDTDLDRVDGLRRIEPEPPS